MAIAFAAADGNAQTAANPTTYSPTGGLIVGQRHILCMRVATATVTSVTDNGGNTYTQIGYLNNTGWGYQVYAFDAVISTAATVVTMNYSAVPSASPKAHSYRATGANSSVAAQLAGQYIAVSTVITDAITSGNLTPAAQPGLLIGWCSLSGGANTATPGTGFTDRGEITAGQHERYEDKAISSVSAVAATFTASLAGAATVFGIYLQEAAAAVGQSSRVVFIG